MAKLRPPGTRVPTASETDSRLRPRTLFEKGRAKTGGRPRGQGNLISADTRRDILRGIAAHGCDGKGTGGIAGAVYAACADNLRNAVSLLTAIVPKEASVNVTRTTEVQYTSIQELDDELRRLGLPPVGEVFKLSYASDIDDATEAELVDSEPTPTGP